MKRNSLITLVALALVALLVTAYSRTPQTGAVKKVSVTSQTLASQRAGQPYVIDLTRTGAVYEISAGIDYSRVRVRTATGEKPLSDLVKLYGKTGKFLLGATTDLVAANFGFSPDDTLDPSTEAAKVKPPHCTGGLCTCNRTAQCTIMARDYCVKGSVGCGAGYGTNPNLPGCMCADKTVKPNF